MAALSSSAVTYSEVGATSGELPAGYRHIRRTRFVGLGAPALNRCGSALLTWELHRRAGLRVVASTSTVEADAVVVLGLGAAGIGVFAPCRVLAVHHDTRHYGFTYGTLPGHPETGEERFEVRLGDADRVLFTITAFSRPADRLSRRAGPVATRIQDAITERYLTAAEHLARAP